MELCDFVRNKEVEYTKHLINKDDIKNIEKEIGVSFGTELTEYSLEYGYLAFRHIELYGIYANQMIESDMVKQTKYLHKYFPKTVGYIALENIGEGDYALVSSDDDVFEYYSEEDQLRKTGLKLFDYILKRFQEIDM